MDRYDVYKGNKNKLVNIVVLIILLVFVWLNDIAINFQIMATIIVGSGVLYYLNMVFSKMTISENELEYTSMFVNRKISFHNIIGVDNKKRAFSRIFGGAFRETGVFKKIILVSDEDKIFYVDSVFAHSIQLWYQTLGQLMDKDILITDNAKDAYAYILNKDIGVYK